jgi:hypothetical protein
MIPLEVVPGRSLGTGERAALYSVVSAPMTAPSKGDVMRAQWAVAVVATCLVSGCAQHRQRPEPSASAHPLPEPPVGSAPGQVVPDPAAATINSGLGQEEALWHVRAALNVAALSCERRPGGAHIVQRYNMLLTDRKPVLAKAYAAEVVHHPQAELDRHMTQLYNYFAQPPAQSGLCAAAAEAADHVTSVSPSALVGEAPAELAKLEAPILDYYRAYAVYRRDLAQWQMHPQMAAAERRAPSIAQKVAAPRAERIAVAERTGLAWRIQLGAFTGKVAAQAAWAKARIRVPSLAGYRPHYQKVPSSALIRLQVGKADDRTSAIRLCAAAAAGGFDCFPVAR